MLSNQEHLFLRPVQPFQTTFGDQYILFDGHRNLFFFSIVRRHKNSELQGKHGVGSNFEFGHFGLKLG